METKQDLIKLTPKGYIRFYDKILKKTLTIGKTTGLFDEDYKIYSDYNKKYYNENSHLIPKYIYYNKKNELFYVQFLFNGKNFSLGSYHTLQEAEQMLLSFKIFLLT